MPTYIILMNYTEQGIRNIKESPTRIQGGDKALEALGDSLIGAYPVMGQYDRVAIVDLPSDELAMTTVLGMNAAGDVRTTTLKAFSNEQFAEIVKKLP
ncbi:GYD domain-containing protein [Chloroflexota bacterium]